MFGRRLLVLAAVLVAGAGVLFIDGKSIPGAKRAPSESLDRTAELGLDADTLARIRSYVGEVELEPRDLTLRRAIELDHKVGRKALETGDHERVYDTYRKVTEISLRLGNPLGVGIGLNALSHELARMNRREDAIEARMLAYVLLRKTNDPEESGVGEMALGELMAKHDRSLGMMWRQRAKVSLEGTKHREDYVRLLSDLGTDFGHLGQTEESHRLYREAWEQARELGSGRGHKWARWSAALNYVDALKRTGDCEQAVAIGDEVLPSFAPAERETSTYYSMLGSLAGCYETLGDAKRARNARLEAYAHYEVERAKSLGDQGRAKLDRENANLVNAVVDSWVKAGDLRTALAILETNKARTLNDILDDPEQRETYARHAKLQAEQARARAALFAQMPANAEESDDAESEAEGNTATDLPDRYFALLAEQDATARDAARESQLRTLAVRSALRPEDVDAIRASLASDEAFISMYATRTGLSAFVMRSGGIELVPLHIEHDDYLLAVRGLQLALTNAHNDFWRRPARTLHDEVFAPIAARLGPEVRVLLYSADGLLSRVPLSVLHDGERHLVQRYAIQRVPSLRFLSPERGTGTRATRGVACVDPKVRGARLPYQQETGEALSKIYEDKLALLSGADCSAAELERSLGALDELAFLHVGAHGRYHARDPLKSGIRLASAEDEKGEFWDARAMGALDLSRLALVSLASCEAGITDAYNPRDVFGIQRTLFYGGARQVLAPLWSVQDQATSSLMQHFYSGYARDGQAARALQAAQVRMIGGEKQHPHYWAGFTLVGGNS